MLIRQPRLEWWEFSSWYNGITDPSAVSGCRFDPLPNAVLKDLVWPQLWHRLQLQLGFDPWSGNHICHRAAEKEKKIEWGLVNCSTCASNVWI